MVDVGQGKRKVKEGPANVLNRLSQGMRRQTLRRAKFSEIPDMQISDLI